MEYILLLPLQRELTLCGVITLDAVDGGSLQPNRCSVITMNNRLYEKTISHIHTYRYARRM